jgi:2-methylcitrate dehydratase PrpD
MLARFRARMIMLHKPNVTQRNVTQGLAHLVVTTRWDDIPQPVRLQAKRSFMNFFAVALAGCRTGPVEIALRSLSEFSGGKQATLVGRNERIDALSAAFLNAAGANVFDFCDTHVRTVIHACVNDPAVLGLRGKVIVEGDPAISTVAVAVDITAGGKTHNLAQAAARGGDRNPMSDKDLEDKLRTAAAGWDPRHDIAPLIDAVWALEQSADVSKLASLAVPRG